jgi:uncharacterized protein YcbX
MARLERLAVFPVKGLDGIDLEQVTILEGGTLEHDREFAFFDTRGATFNGTQTTRVHDLAVDFDPASSGLTVETPDGDQHRFDLDNELDQAERWFNEFFDEELDLRRDRSLGFVDRREMGPSVISTATLETVASWFDEMTLDGARRRFRANIEISGVPPFWEDRFVGERAPSFEIGGVTLEGVTPCGRCVVPQRDPDTGESIPEFRQRFVRERSATFPERADPTAFEHHYTVMIIARAPEPHREQALHVGDRVSVIADE